MMRSSDCIVLKNVQAMAAKLAYVAEARVMKQHIAVTLNIKSVHPWLQPRPSIALKTFTALSVEAPS